MRITPYGAFGATHAGRTRAVRLSLWPGAGQFRLGLAKLFSVGGDRTINFETLFINAFNTRNTVVGNTGGATHSIDSTTFGQSTSTAIGPRNIQFRLRFNF